MFNDTWVSSILTKHLDNSRLSLSQFAEKCEVNKGIVSELRDGKRTTDLKAIINVLTGCQVDSSEIIGYINWMLEQKHPKLITHNKTI